MSDRDETQIIDEQDSEEASTEAAAKALADAGDEVGALKLKYARLERSLARERGARQRQELEAYKVDLAKEFDNADPELITGKTKQEMRASAERIHKAVEAVIAKKGLTAPKESETTLKGDLGAPPAVATEAVTGEAPMDWSDLQRAAQFGKKPDGQPFDRKAVLAEMKTGGARRITRPTIAGAALKARGEPGAAT